MQVKETIHVSFAFDGEDVEMFRESKIELFRQKMATSELIGDYVQARKMLQYIQLWQMRTKENVAFVLITDAVDDYLLRGEFDGEN